MPLWDRLPLVCAHCSSGIWIYAGASQDGGISREDRFWVRHGYARVLIDERGTGASFGVSRYGPGTASDLYDLVEWVVHRPWSNGRVGAIGVSVEGTASEIRGRLTAPVALGTDRVGRPDRHRRRPMMSQAAVSSCTSIWVLELTEECMERSAALVLYEKVVATMAGVERKGDTMPYTSLNGHMFSVLHKDGSVALRLPSPEREAFLKKYKTTLSSQYGIVQPEYVVVPDALLARTKELQRFFEISQAYVGSLKPKPTTRKKDPSPKKKLK